jgi:hypothetical protein
MGHSNLAARTAKQHAPAQALRARQVGKSEDLLSAATHPAGADGSDAAGQGCLHLAEGCGVSDSEGAGTQNEGCVQPRASSESQEQILPLRVL